MTKEFCEYCGTIHFVFMPCQKRDNAKKLQKIRDEEEFEGLWKHKQTCSGKPNPLLPHPDPFKARMGVCQPAYCPHCRYEMYQHKHSDDWICENRSCLEKRRSHRLQAEARKKPWPWSR